MQHTIQSLRRGGYKVRVIHGEVKNLADCENNLRQAADRYTLIQLTEIATSISVDGWAYCSKKDNYSRKLGNSIALGRALGNLEKYKAQVAGGSWYDPAVTLLTYKDYSSADFTGIENFENYEKYAEVRPGFALNDLTMTIDTKL